MDSDRSTRNLAWGSLLVVAIFLAVIAVVFFPVFYYTVCRIEVPSGHLAILMSKTGEDLQNDQEIAPDKDHKGLQLEVLAEGRHFKDPWNWNWQVVEQIEIPQNKLGVRIRLFGDDLPYEQLIAWKENQKGIVSEVLRPGRYPINGWVVGSTDRPRDTCAEHIELHEPVVISAGFRGVVTNLSGPMPEDPNVLLVPQGYRGVQSEAETLDAGTYYVNPYVKRIDLVDCRSKRFDLTSDGDMGFPSKDGFWVTLDGTIEFRVDPEKAAQVFVTYNETDEEDRQGRASVEKEIINKIILPNARSFCRLGGSDHSGKEFITGDTRTKFQQAFQDEMARTCETQGVQIIQALITKINPPQKIAQPVRERQIAAQKQQQYSKEIQQQESEKQLAIEQQLIKRKKELIGAQQEVVRVVTEAQRKQEVALIHAQQKLGVAQSQVLAAADLAVAIRERGKAEAEVIRFKNEAEAAGWRKSVSAFANDGNSFARWVMLKKIAPAYRQMMINTANSPIMGIFEEFNSPSTTAGKARPEVSPKVLPESETALTAEK